MEIIGRSGFVGAGQGTVLLLFKHETTLAHVVFPPHGARGPGHAELHNPDTVIGGLPDVIVDFGGLSENSSIGIQNRWLQPDIYEAVKDLPPSAKVRFTFTAE